MTGSEILIQSLLDEGVDTIFGFPGGAVIGIYDVLYRTPQIRHILVRHEQGATHAADGYARATGKPGVVFVTSGPGATNTVTGIATAYMDSIPIVVFTGQVPSAMIGNDAFQEADIIGITRPITKHSYLVKDVNQLAQIVREAFYIATTGRPGPVLVDLPKDMLVSKAVYQRPKKPQIRGYNPVTRGHYQQIAKAAHLISQAKRPLIYAGGGVISGNAAAELTELAIKGNIPVTTTLTGLGAFPEDHPLALKMLGMHGTWYANMAICECDVLIAVGARFDDRVTGRLDKFSVNSKKIHIDIDPACIAKNVPVDIPIVGDVKHVLPQLTQMIQRPDTNGWCETINQWKKEHPLRYRNRSDQIMPQFVVEKISELTRGEAIIVTDVGQNQMWTAQYYQFKHPRSMLTSGGLGTMGYGFPAAVGAAIGCPGRIVFCITGDGGFQMMCQELATAVYYRIPVKVAILNNGYLGMVRQWQNLFFESRYSHTYLQPSNPDFVKLAESYGAVGLRVERPEEVLPALKEAMKITDRPVVLDFIVAAEENVYPMVPAGAALYEMIEGR
ncbi:MAG: biosynthetic-type acetolactate synthase large subunit [candidate division KSB1 bacterium]|nr:biosynthetic-type acetolactate synthase large subunit [candidate division KSB1 bacterium]